MGRRTRMTIWERHDFQPVPFGAPAESQMGDDSTLLSPHVFINGCQRGEATARGSNQTGGELLGSPDQLGNSLTVELTQCPAILGADRSQTCGPRMGNWLLAAR